MSESQKRPLGTAPRDTLSTPTHATDQRPQDYKPKFPQAFAKGIRTYPVVERQSNPVQELNIVYDNGDDVLCANTIMGLSPITGGHGHGQRADDLVACEPSGRHDSTDQSTVTSPTSSRKLDPKTRDDGLHKPDNVTNIGKKAKENTHAPPPWSELKTKAGKERKRLPLACIACRRKKIRCSGEKPACKHCLRSRIPCVYKVTTRKAAPRTDYMTMLDKRLKRMEERVIKIIPEPEPGRMAMIGRATVKPPGIISQKSNGAKKRAADEAFGGEITNWADNVTTSDAGHKPGRHEQAETQLQMDGVENLPSKDIQEHLSEVFFDCLYGQSYHILHKPSFMRRLK